MIKTDKLGLLVRSINELFPDTKFEIYIEQINFKDYPGLVLTNEESPYCFSWSGHEDTRIIVVDSRLPYEEMITLLATEMLINVSIDDEEFNENLRFLADHYAVLVEKECKERPNFE